MKGGGVLGLLFGFGRAKRMMNKIAKAPKKPMTPAPPMKATTTESTPWGTFLFSVLASAGGAETLTAGQVERGAHFEVPLRAQREFIFRMPLSNKAFIFCADIGPRGFRLMIT